jgi:thiol-disulfide isomerase/thioredoxin
MLRKITFLFIMALSFGATAQPVYDSLKEVYHAQRVFENRIKGDVSKYMHDELNKISDPAKKQLASCAFAENLYGYGWVRDKELLRMVDDVIREPHTEEVKTTAISVKTEITRTLLDTKIIDISLKDVQGNTHRLDDYYTSGKDFIVVDLWATWCGPCIAEMKKFNDLRQQYKNIEFYSISLDEDYTRVQRFVDRNKSYTWPIVWAGMGSPLWSYFKARHIPAFVIVDKTGTIIAHVTGRGLADELKKINR